MLKRTFEVFSKYISKQHNVSIVFDTDGTAHADMKNDVLHLPAEIANEHALGALALTMHEAAHIKHSKIIPIQQVAPMQSDFHILNAIEDIRIDRKNFHALPNVYAFYEELVKKHLDLTDPKLPQSSRLLCAGILWCEGFNPKLNDSTPRQAARYLFPDSLITTRQTTSTGRGESVYTFSLALPHTLE